MKLQFVATVVAAALLSLPESSEACGNKEQRCICQCDKECRCGTEIVKECRIIKKCWNKRPCSNEIKAPKCSGYKRVVCHIPPGNPQNAHTICIGQPAVAAHLAHGDYLGKCLSCKQHCITKKCCRYKKVCRPCDPKCPPCLCDAGPSSNTDAYISRHDSFVLPPKPDSLAKIPDGTAGQQQDAGAKPDILAPDITQVSLPDASSAPDNPRVPDPDSAISIPDSTVPDPDSADVVPDSTVLADAGTLEPDSGGGPMPILDAGVSATVDMKVIMASDGPCNCPNGFEEPKPEPKKALELVGGGCSMTNESSPGGIALLGLLAAGLLLLRRRATGLLVLALLVLLPATAGADDLTLPVPGLAPTPHAGGYYSVDGAKVSNHGHFRSSFLFNYARRPLALQRASDGKLVDTVIKGRADIDFMVAFGLFDRLEVGIAMPVTLHQEDGNIAALGRTSNILGGWGDARISTKVLLGANDNAALALVGTLGLPSGRTSQLLGNSTGVFFAPEAVATVYHKRFDASLSIGWQTRIDDTVRFGEQTITLDDGMTAGFGVRIPLWKKKLDFIGDASFAMSAFEFDTEERSAELIGGLRTYLPHGLAADIGGGAGLTRGIGVPQWRVLAGLSWEYGRPEKVCPNPRTIVKTRVRTETRTVVVPVPVKVKIIKQTIFLPPVYFATDKDVILPQSRATMDKVIELLRKHLWVRKVMVEGHTDHRASDEYNLDLSKRRAKSVYNYLIEHGVSPDRLDKIGYGESRRVDTTETVDGMSKNRRVEFIIIDPKE